MSDIDTKASVCPVCKKDLKSWPAKHPIISIFLSIIIFITVINISWNSIESENTQIVNTANEEIINKENWEYSEIEDKMTNKKTKVAISSSINSVDFDFPYHWGSTFDLVLKGDHVIYQVSKWQFLSSFWWDKVRIKFDDKEPFFVNYSMPEDWNSSAIFLWNEKKIIENLRISKKVMIEATFFQEWKQIGEFNIDWLKW